jgi:hypothetical protein
MVNTRFTLILRRRCQPEADDISSRDATQVCDPRDGAAQPPDRLSSPASQQRDTIGAANDVRSPRGCCSRSKRRLAGIVSIATSMPHSLRRAVKE